VIYAHGVMEKHKEGEIIERDAQSAFNTLSRDYTAKNSKGKGGCESGSWIGYNRAPLS